MVPYSWRNYLASGPILVAELLGKWPLLVAGTPPGGPLIVAADNFGPREILQLTLRAGEGHSQISLTWTTGMPLRDGTRLNAVVTAKSGFRGHAVGKSKCGALS